MSMYLGIDTSNYTTSVCLYDSDSGKVISKRKLLPVKDGELGLRQSDAVFHHVQQLPALFEEAFGDFSDRIKAIGVSYAPRTEKGSYMPCFTVGTTAASILSSVLKVPVYRFSHQQGHIAAALYSVDRLDLLCQKHIAFHVSGGTTEALLVNGSDDFLSTEIVAKTLDLNAGQLIDRVGVMLGLSFPCGKELEKLADQCDEKIKVRPTLKGLDCCLSGGQNIAEKHQKEGKSPAYIARFTMLFISSAIVEMSKRIRDKYGDLELVYAGGVMSDLIIRDELRSLHDCVFALPEFSSDNAAGTAVLASVKDRS
ncbi:peptidase M22 [Ruminococcus difficilis]|uniref:N(6)-L-threonylcarbamoyladenine synthase n=1 Tax=Ruminococcus difficilis TaxID=2763069 RepID=A0A934TYQ2_9FIRM|nr:peptidase M22 [Ruminococcus difficilis]MBK6087791.1 peptidase M22 [Ruminococcus difficilis]